MPEKFDAPSTPVGGEENLIESKPKLKNIYKTLTLLEGYADWKKDLPQKIGPWNNSSELFDNVQKAVRDHVGDKVLKFRGKVPSVLEITDENILDIVINNWPEGAPEIKGQRREVLLAVAAHVVRHMETKAYQMVLEDADIGQLKKIGLSPELRDVAVKTLDACKRADILFIRYLAFARLSPKPPEEASFGHFYVPNNDRPHTINSLFPRDTRFIAKKFKEISEMPVDWEKIPGGKVFKEYLEALSGAYQEKDAGKIDDCYKKVSELFEQSASSDFPILVIPSEYTGGYAKPPYHDPELRVCLKAPECREIEKDLYSSQGIMAKCLEQGGRQDFGQKLLGKKIRVVNSIGDYGVGLNFKVFAQASDSMVVMFLSEAFKAQKEMARKKNFKVENLEEEDDKRMSFYGTALHEFGHLHGDEEDPAVKRLGRDWGITIGEAEAETLYRSLIPQMIESGGIEGTKEQWAAALMEISLEELRDKSAAADPEYYYSSAYTLNRLFEEGVVEFDFENGRVSIKNIDAFYKIQKELSDGVLGLYEDESMNPKKADKWIRENCMPNETVKKISDFIKKK